MQERHLRTNSRQVGANRVCLGVITAAVGVLGEVRIRTFTSRPENFAAYGPVSDELGDRSFRVESLRGCEGSVIVRLSGVVSREQAQALSGIHLFVSRSVLPALGEEEWYHSDIIGLSAYGSEGEDCGRIKAVWNFGAGEVLELERDTRAVARGRGNNGRDRESVLIPFTRENVAEVKVHHGCVILGNPAKRFDWQ